MLNGTVFSSNEMLQISPSKTTIITFAKEVHRCSSYTFYCGTHTHTHMRDREREREREFIYESVYLLTEIGGMEVCERGILP